MTTMPPLGVVGDLWLLLDLEFDVLVTQGASPSCLGGLLLLLAFLASWCSAGMAFVSMAAIVIEWLCFVSSLLLLGYASYF
ncbi:hypothetical protein Peur_001145 [Populus x canadensis]